MTDFEEREVPNLNAAPWDALWHPLDAATFTEKPPRRSWLLDGVLPLGKVGMLAAEGGAGKTIALCQLALAVATGAPWLGTFNVAPSAVGRVLLVLGEEDAEEVRRRMWNAAQTMRLSLSTLEEARRRIVALPLAGEPCAFLEAGDHGELGDSAFTKWLRGKLADGGDPWRLIVLDPLSRFAGSDAETDNAAATRFVQSVEALSKATGATSLIAHHTHKGARAQGADASTASARGSSALTDGVRWVATMATEQLSHGDATLDDHLGRIVTLTVTKSNYAKRPGACTLRHDNDHGGALLPCDEVDLDRVKEARDRGTGAAVKQRAEVRERRAAVEEKNADTRAARETRATLEAQRKTVAALHKEAKSAVTKLEKLAREEPDEVERSKLERELADKRSGRDDLEAKLRGILEQQERLGEGE